MSVGIIRQEDERQRLNAAHQAGRAKRDTPFHNADRDIVAEFFARGANPSQAQIDFLLDRGVPPKALGHDFDGGGFVIQVAKVEKVGRRFDFIEDGTNAVIVVARDEDGAPADLVAWLPNETWFGPWLGNVPLLGMENLFAPRFDAPLPVFLSPLGWFQAQRDGVVILNQSAAWRALEGITVAAASFEDGTVLKRMLERPKPKIVLPSKVEKIAA